MWQNDETEWKGTNGKEFQEMWSEKRLQDVDKIGVLLRFKSQFHYYHVCLCKDTDFIF